MQFANKSHEPNKKLPRVATPSPQMTNERVAVLLGGVVRRRPGVTPLASRLAVLAGAQASLFEGPQGDGYGDHQGN